MNASRNQFELLRQRRFLPFFVTQFLGAFNDNIFKNALIILVTFQAASVTDARAADLVEPLPRDLHPALLPVLGHRRADRRPVTRSRG